MNQAPQGRARAATLACASLLLGMLAFGCDDNQGEDAGAADRGADAARPDAMGRATADAGLSSACRPVTGTEPPACGTAIGVRRSLVTFGAEIDAKARRYDRVFHALNAHGVDLNADVVVPLSPTSGQELVKRFAMQDDGWDFEAFSGTRVEDVVTATQRVAGLYAGVGAAADAFRYATLRDEGAACAEIDVARAHLVADLGAMHLAVAITGVEGVIARGFARKDLPGDGETPTTTLFDDAGAPLPPEKDNGTWREDNSGGEYPGYIWVDSCSRDMLVGWAFGFAAAWEAIRLDPEFDTGSKRRLQDDAAAIARSLMKVQESGYDLEIRDADGRRTLHGILHEESLDRTYVPGFANGFNALMALGIVGGFAYVAEAPDIDDYLNASLITERKLHAIARKTVGVIDFGTGTNFSNYNMAITAGVMAARYLCDDEARAAVREAIRTGLYAQPGRDRQPDEQGQTFYDFVNAYATAGGTPWSEPDAKPDEAAIERGLETLRQFPEPPFWNVTVENCDATEVSKGRCVRRDGVEVELLGAGWNQEIVADRPTPMRIRPPSNYYWRSNPYEVNGGGDGELLLPGVDFRGAYWIGRWFVRR